MNLILLFLNLLIVDNAIAVALHANRNEGSDSSSMRTVRSNYGNTPHCSFGKTYDTISRTCLPSCGSGAWYSQSRRGCICHDLFKTYKNGACVNIFCGSGAYFSLRKLHCACTDSKKTWTSKGCISACGTGQTLTGNTCTCTDTSQELVNDICVARCGTYQTRNSNGDCICVSTLDSQADGSCGCNSPQVQSKDMCYSPCYDGESLQVDNGNGVCYTACQDSSGSISGTPYCCSAPGTTFTCTNLPSFALNPLDFETQCSQLGLNLPQCCSPFFGETPTADQCTPPDFSLFTPLPIGP